MRMIIMNCGAGDVKGSAKVAILVHTVSNKKQKPQVRTTWV
jgi:hypothetical protein